MNPNRGRVACQRCVLIQTQLSRTVFVAELIRTVPDLSVSETEIVTGPREGGLR
jgi:hypothetical protein